MNKRNKTALLTRGAIIAAIYVVLTYITNLFGLANGAVQVRLSEALCVLPVFFPEAIGGLTLGCFIANLVTGCIPTDIIFGSVATLIGAFGTYFLRKKPVLAVLPPIFSNAIIVPFVLKYAYGIGGAWWYFALTVGLGEIISCGVFGSVIIKIVQKNLKILK